MGRERRVTKGERWLHHPPPVLLLFFLECSLMLLFIGSSIANPSSSSSLLHQNIDARQEGGITTFNPEYDTVVTNWFSNPGHILPIAAAEVYIEYISNGGQSTYFSATAGVSEETIDSVTYVSQIFSYCQTAINLTQGYNNHPTLQSFGTSASFGNPQQLTTPGERGARDLPSPLSSSSSSKDPEAPLFNLKEYDFFQTLFDHFSSEFGGRPPRLPARDSLLPSRQALSRYTVPTFLFSPFISSSFPIFPSSFFLLPSSFSFFPAATPSRKTQEVGQEKKAHRHLNKKWQAIEKAKQEERQRFLASRGLSSLQPFGIEETVCNLAVYAQNVDVPHWDPCANPASPCALTVNVDSHGLELNVSAIGVQDFALHLGTAVINVEGGTSEDLYGTHHSPLFSFLFLFSFSCLPIIFALHFKEKTI